MEHFVKFGEINTWTDLGLYLTAYEIPDAKAITNLVEIQGSSNVIDLSEAIGSVQHEPRPSSWTFYIPQGVDWVAKRREVNNLLNGKLCNIVMYNDPDYYYIGRLVVENTPRSDNVIHHIVISSNLYPYKNKKEESEFTYSFNSTTNLVERLNKWKETTVKYDTAVVSQQGSIMSPYFDVSPSTKYTFSLKANTDKNIRCFIWQKTSAAASQDSSGKISLTLAKDKTSGRHVGTLTTKSDTRVLAFRVQPLEEIRICKAQVEKGAVATEYKPKGGFVVSIENGSIKPKITVTSETTVEFPDNKRYTISAGTHSYIGLPFVSGENIIVAKGSGTLKITCQERSL